MNLSIRPIKTIDDCNSIEHLQIEIWGTEEGVVPGHLLLTIAKEGGIVHVAYDDEKPAGFAYGFLAATKNGRLKLASHQAGVLPEYQSHGVGYQLKLAQRDAAIKKNLNLITWTFDPLLGLNAFFNLRKLGAVSNTYLQNLYGVFGQGINQGLPSDRFRVDWWITSKHVTRRLEKQFSNPDSFLSRYPILNPTMAENDLSLLPETFQLPTNTRYCLVEMPVDIDLIKQTAPTLARQWQRQTRKFFKAAFAQGYTAIDLLRHKGHNYYLLQKNWSPDEN